MSITQFRADDTDLHRHICPRCGAELPDGAAFCNVCGERLDSTKSLAALLKREEDIATRYRITSLVRRRPFVNLYFALDFQQTTNQGQSRMVAIRDIDLSLLTEADLTKAAEPAQQEYDLLRQGDIPYVMPATDLRYFQGHLFLVAGHPNLAPAAPAVALAPGAAGSEGDARLNTLQDYLQSGQGLPSEQRALQWTRQLCQAVDGLHQRQIVIGDLDPFTILYSGDISDPDGARLSPLISWLTPALRELLPSSTTTSLSYFVAPEAIQGEASARSDVYSLGAILYLLLTGMPPGESLLRNRGRQAVLRAPHEINGRISVHASDCVMQALALQPSERFESAAALAKALGDARYRPSIGTEHDAPRTQASEVETVRIIPLSRKDAERWRAAQRRNTLAQPQQSDQASTQEALEHPSSPPIPQRPVTPRPPQLPEEAVPAEKNWDESPGSSPASPPAAIPETPAVNASAALSGGAVQDKIKGFLKTSTWKQYGTAFLTAISTRLSRFRRVPRSGPVQSRPAQNAPVAQGQGSWIDQLKQVLLGQQQQVIMAAAIVETPLRVLPDQMYTLRIHVIGRDEPGVAAQRRTEKQEISLSGLSHGDTVQIEVRSVLQQSYAYIVQRATVTIPAEGYVAEVTIPMQSLSSIPTGRRDRLHIFFMDEHHDPLYEKPFAVEIFVSQHVKRGSEGHNVLTIPF